MTEEEFHEHYADASAYVADTFYPEGHPRRGEYLRDQGVLFTLLNTRLKEQGFLEGPEGIYRGSFTFTPGDQ